MSEIHLDPPPNKRQLMQHIEDLEAEIASLRERLAAEQKAHREAHEESRLVVSSVEERLAQAERERDEARQRWADKVELLSRLYRAVRRFDGEQITETEIVARAEAVEAQVRELVEWQTTALERLAWILEHSVNISQVEANWRYWLKVHGVKP